MIKRIVSLFIVVCLLLSLFCVTASAADIYEIDKSVALMSTSPLSVSDSGISTAAVEPSDLDDYLSYGSYSVADYFASLNQYFWGTTVPKYSGYTFITNLTELFSDFFNSAGFYLRDDGSSSNVNYSNNIGDLVRMGFLGLSTNIKAVTSAIQSLDFNDYSSILSNIYSSVDGLESGLTSANTAIGGVTTAVNNVRTAVNSVVSGLTTVNTSVNTVNSSVNSVESAVDTVDATLLTIRNRLSASSGSDFLNSLGQLSQLSGESSLTSIIRIGFNGVRALVAGSEADNVYTSTIHDNNNLTSSVNSRGLGPLLNTQLSNIGENLGHLAYIFASDDDIKLKQDSQPLLDETESFYNDSSDSKVKVSAGDVGSFKGFGSDMLDIVDTGADIGDVVTILSNDNSFRWFTAQTAADLDSIGTATISDEESTYHRLHREFNEIYFPDRVGGGN